jgi:tetratricopeptide (TPR) repeat protein
MMMFIRFINKKTAGRYTVLNLLLCSNLAHRYVWIRCSSSKRAGIKHIEQGSGKVLKPFTARPCIWHLSSQTRRAWRLCSTTGTCRLGGQRAQLHGLITNDTCINRAASRLQLQDYAGALQDCEAALVVNQNNTKALYRRAQALLGLGGSKVTAAVTSLQQVIRAEPNNKEVSADALKSSCSR